MEIEKYRGYEIQIKCDDNPESPREWDDFGTMTCFHGRYNLGDSHNMEVEELGELVAQDHIISLPLYLYDHSGITINTTGFSCGWDSGQVGYIHISKDKIREWLEVKRITKKVLKRVYQMLKNEVETYDDYITGNVYWYSILENGEEVDSLYGFFGYDHEKSGLLSEARSAIDWHIKQARLAKQEKLKTYIKNKVGLNHRVLTLIN